VVVAYDQHDAAIITTTTEPSLTSSTITTAITVPSTSPLQF